LKFLTALAGLQIGVQPPVPPNDSLVGAAKKMQAGRGTRVGIEPTPHLHETTPMEWSTRRQALAAAIGCSSFWTAGEQAELQTGKMQLRRRIPNNS
jgi:hypothetical protein